MTRKGKKENRFRDYQEQNQIDRVVLIEDYLEVLTKTRIRFRYITDVANAVSIHLSGIQAAPCSKSTVLRNPRYKMLLLSFFAAQNLNVKKNSSQDKTDTQEISSVIMKLENLNTKRENLRLKRYIEQMQGQSEESILDETTKFNDDRLRNLERDFVSVCQVVWKLLENFEAIIDVDIELNRIVDKTEIVNNVICDSPLTIPFFNWLRSVPTQGRVPSQ